MIKLTDPNFCWEFTTVHALIDEMVFKKVKKVVIKVLGKTWKIEEVKDK